MKKRFLSFLLIYAMLGSIGGFCVNAQGNKIEGLKVEGKCVLTNTVDAQENLFDSNEESVVVFKTETNSPITVKLPQTSDVSGIKITIRNFSAWSNIEKLAIKADNTEKELVVKNSAAKTNVVELETDFKGISEFDILVREFDANTKFDTFAFADIEVYGEGKNQTGSSSEAGELEYGVDFTIKEQSAKLGGWEYALNRCFDHNSTTNGGLANVTEGYIIYEFPYPTDVTKLSFQNVINGDWATPKGVIVKVYDENTVYRQKLTNPEPITSGEIFPLENTGKKQEIELLGDMYKRVTHLIVQFEDGYINSSGAKWGGWSEMELHGLGHPDAKRTSEIIATKLVSNVEILCDMGIVDGQPTEEYMNAVSTRLDMAKAILRLSGEYEKAVSYKGTFNFSDADAENYNLLSYIYAYKCFGIEGDGNNRFMPYEPLTARACYKLILSFLGYKYDKDFTWENLHELCYKLGIGDMIYEESFTNKDMCNAIYEAFNVPIKDSDVYYLDKLKADGRIPDIAWEKISDKQDRVSPVLDGDYIIPDTFDRNADFTFTYNEEEHILQEGAFCYNTPFHYSGIYHGTLPLDNPESKRKEFGEAMQKAGAKAMRFPGGLPAHQYFIEGEEYAIQFDQKKDRFAPTELSGLYDSKDPNDAWYVDFYDWLDFCKEYDIEPVFQTNPGFFVDGNGEVRQAYPCFLIKNTDNGIITSPELYDHNRIDEAVKVFEKNVKEIVEKGYYIRYWEIGNEDNYKNYSSLPTSDVNNPLAKDFVKATTGYARVIKKYFPDAYIMVPDGFSYKEMMSEEDYALLSATTKHYPFGTWTIPPDNEKASAARLAGTNEQNFPRNYSKEQMREDKENGKLTKAVTETMAWRFEGWNPTSLMQTFANALNVAHNWGELVFDSGFTGLNVLHDLESPWFGSVLYDVMMDPGTRYFQRNESLSLTVHEYDVPDLYKFEDTYYFNPASTVFEMLGRHCGGRVLTNSRTNVQRFISGYASMEGDELRFTIVNRFDEALPVKINLPNIKVLPQTTEAQILQSDYLRAVLEVEYNNIKTQIDIGGNENNKEAPAIEFEAMPHSVTHFCVKAELIQ